MDHYAPRSMRDPQDAHDVQKWVEDRRMPQFLKNLDPEFESRRAAFCHQDSLPTMEEAVSAMVNEESRLRVMSNNNPVKSAYVTLGERDCYNCGEKGHLSYNCPLPKNYGGRLRYPDTPVHGRIPYRIRIRYRYAIDTSPIRIWGVSGKKINKKKIGYVI